MPTEHEIIHNVIQALIRKNSSANTFPYIQVQNSTAKIEHEASTSFNW